MDVLNQYNVVKDGMFIKFDFDPNCIADGVQPESLSSKSPFNMSLYYFAKDSYMMDALNYVGGQDVLVGNINTDLMDIRGLKGPKVNIHSIFGTKKNPFSEELIEQCGGIDNVLASLQDYAEAQKQEDSDWYKQILLK